MPTILHLTDLHFGLESAHSPSELAQRTNTLEALRSVLAGLRADARPDVVVVSGDIGWAGRPSDYAAAAAWLRTVLQALDLPPDRLVICPGNHDLDRAEAEVLDRPSVADRADRLLRVEKLGQIPRPFAEFEAFAREMGIPPLAIGTAESHLVGVRTVCGIRFVVANTAWFCRDNEDKGKLFVGLPLLEVMAAAGQLTPLTEASGAEFTVGVLHHPETWLSDDETASYEGRAAAYYFLADRCDVLLSGHTHGGLERPRRIGDRGLLFVGGAGYSGGRYRNNVSLLRFDAASRTVVRTPYEFDPRDGAWHARDATTHDLRQSSPAQGGGKPREEAGRTGEFRVHRPPRNLPPRQTTFAGREDEEQALHEQFSRSRRVGITQQTAVHGHGGIGKTALAIEYGWRHLEDYPGGVFFLSCESELPPPVAELAPHLGIESTGTSEEAAVRVRAHLEAGEPCLLILDNVNDAQQWRSKEWSAHLPGEACRRLITTRAESLPGVAMYALQRLTREDGVKLLEGYRADVAGNEEHAVAVVEWFDGLAVGLTVVGAYMARHKRLSWRDYAQRLTSGGLETVRQTERAAGPPPDYDARVDAVFDELLEALPSEQRRALEYAALLPEDQIYAPWLTDLLANDGEIEAPDLPGYEEQASDPVVWALIDAQLLRVRGEDERVVGLHRVLRRRLRERLGATDAVDQLTGGLVGLAKRRGVASHAAVTERALRRELTPLAALSRELSVLDRMDSAVGLANWITAPLRDLGRYAECRQLLEEYTSDEPLEALSMSETASLYSNLALILQNLGEFPDARRRMERAIAIDEQHFDSGHPTLAISYSNLALILQDLGELADARRRMEQAIAIEEQHFVSDHPTLAISYSNIALILQDLGELADARRRMEQAIAIDEQHFDSDHHKLGIRYSNLAMILTDLGDLVDARQRMERAIEIEERHFDFDHPTLAKNYNNLAHIELRSGNRDRACELFHRAKAILDKQFGATHPHVVMVTNSIVRHCGDSPTN